MDTVRKLKPDIIFLDIVMPDMDGAQVASQIRDDKDCKDIPIVFLTALTSKEELEGKQGVVSGEKFIAKPITVQNIVEAIEKEV